MRSLDSSIGIKVIAISLVITYAVITCLGSLYGIASGLVHVEEVLYAVAYPTVRLSSGYSLLTIVNYVLNLHIVLNGYEVFRGYVWELLTSIFIHAGIPHLVLNVIALILSMYMASTLNRVSGWGVITVFLVSGLVGNIATATLMPGVSSLGASGGIFGLMTYLAVKEFREGGGYSLIVLIAIIFTISSLPIIGYPNVVAHAVGLTTGFILGYLH